MTREQMAIYLITMAWMESEPVTVFEFELKMNTRKRSNDAWQLKNAMRYRCGNYSWNDHMYYSKDPRITWINHRSWHPDLDTMSVQVHAGSWSDKEHIEWLETELDKRKVEYTKFERR